MGQWWCDYSHDVYDTEEEAREAALEALAFLDIEDYIIDTNAFIRKALVELARLDSPLYYETLTQIENVFLEDAIGEYPDES